MLIAVIALEPFANISLSEFAAAICPNIYKSSTIGVIKSRLWTIILLSSSL